MLFASCFLVAICHARITCPSAPTCLEEETSIHPSGDCVSYYKCNEGSIILFYCPPGLYFSEDLNVCMHIEEVSCIPCNDVPQHKGGGGGGGGGGCLGKHFYREVGCDIIYVIISS